MSSKAVAKCKYKDWFNANKRSDVKITKSDKALHDNKCGSDLNFIQQIQGHWPLTVFECSGCGFIYLAN